MKSFVTIQKAEQSLPGLCCCFQTFASVEAMNLVLEIPEDFNLGIFFEDLLQLLSFNSPFVLVFEVVKFLRLHDQEPFDLETISNRFLNSNTAEINDSIRELNHVELVGHNGNIRKHLSNGSLNPLVHIHIHDGHRLVLPGEVFFQNLHQR